MTDDTRPVWVLGGGGVTGIAWEVGVLAGLADEGVTVTPEAVLIGTSSGAVVGAQIASGTPLAELYERQLQGVAHETSTALGLLDLLRLAPSATVRPDPRAGRSPPRSPRPRRTHPRPVTATPDSRSPPAGSHLEGRGPAHRRRRRGVGRQPHHHPARRCLPCGRRRRELRHAALQRAGDDRRPPVHGRGHALDPQPRPRSRGRPGGRPRAQHRRIGPWARIAKQRAALGANRRVELLLRDPASRRAQGSNVMDRSVVPALVAAAREQGRREASRVAAALAGIGHS